MEIGMKINERFENSPPKIIFIDLDGTLVDTLPKLHDVYLNFLKKFGINGSQVEFEENNGALLPEIIQTLKTRYQLPDSASELIEQYKGLIKEIYERGDILIKGTVESLAFLKKLHLKIMLVTSSSSELASLVLKNPKLRNIFDGSVTGDLVQKGKPDPEIYLLALEKAGLKPQDAVVIEDSLHGVHAALNAGIYTIRLNTKIEEICWHDGWIELEDWYKIKTFFKRWFYGLSDV
jgi:HAD superfamily hydrolase (TIGR01509 family)